MGGTAPASRPISILFAALRARSALGLEQLVEAVHVDAEPLVGSDLLDQLAREAVRIREQEGVVTGDPAARRTALRLFEQDEALAECLREPLLFGRGHLPDEGFVLAQLGIRRTEAIDHGGDDRVQHDPFDAEPASVRDHPPEHPAQDVPAAFVRRLDAVGDQERGGPPVLGDDLERDVVPWIVPVGAPREPLCGLEHRAEQVGFEDVVDALQDQRHALQRGPRVDVLAGERGEDLPPPVHLVLDEDEVPDLHEPFLVDVGAALGAVLGPAIDEDLAARPGGAGGVGPPVVRRLARFVDDPAAHDPFDRDPTPSTHASTTSSSSSNTVTQSRSCSIPYTSVVSSCAHRTASGLK